jgi:hypothetical protein
MRFPPKSRDQAIFGDFQTPLALSREIVAFLKNEEGGRLRSVVEPSCGRGSFLQAAAESFGKTRKYFGFDLNTDYVGAARECLRGMPAIDAQVECGDFYEKDWRDFLLHLTSPLLVIGNPPWITNAAMGAMSGRNLPVKTNFQRHAGFAAKTGKANFDISEWMLIRLLEALQGIPATVAMLCKTSTARKVLRHAWIERFDVGPSSMHLIDANAHFGASVDACLLYTHTGMGDAEATATVYPKISFENPGRTFGLFSGELVSDIDAYRRLRDVDGLEYRRWRSGVKHDAAKIMEFRRKEDEYMNGLGESCRLEAEYLYPLLKSSDLANGRLVPSKYVLLTQKRVTDDTSEIRHSAPLTWRYLLRHAKYLDERRSSIYAKRPRFSVFGIGNYTFAPWKVAISGLYKGFAFQAIGTFEGRPIVVDDTCYFMPCASEIEARFFADLLNSETARRFISALVFSDSKRPITIDVLKRIDLKRLATRLGEETRAREFLSSPGLATSHQRLLVFEDAQEYGRPRPPSKPLRIRRNNSRRNTV